MQSRSFSVLVTLLAATVAMPARSADQVAITGAGALACPKYLEIIDTAMDRVHRTQTDVLNASLVLSWAEGFLNGMNVQRAVASPGKDMLNLPAPPSVKAYLDNYCKENPLGTISVASMSLFVFLETRKK